MKAPLCAFFVVLSVSAPRIMADDTKELAAVAQIRKTLHHVVLREPIGPDTSVEKALDILVNRIRAQKINGRPISVSVVLHSGESPPPAEAHLYPPIADALTQQISVPLSKISLEDALEFVDRLAGLKYIVRADGIEFVPVWIPEPRFQRDFPIPRDFFPAYEEQDRLDHTDIARQMRQDIRGFLKEKVMFFDEEATASINADATRLTVRGTELLLQNIPCVLQTFRPPCVFPTYGPEVPKMIAHGKNAALTRKVQRIILPEVKFANTRVIDALQILHDLSVRYDTESPNASRGVKIVLEEDGHPVTASPRTANPNDDPNADWFSLPKYERELDYAATNVTLLDALETVAKRGHWEVVIGPSVVTLRWPAPGDAMITREYLIPPDMAADLYAKTPWLPSPSGKDFLYMLLDMGGGASSSGSSLHCQANFSQFTLRDSQERQRETRKMVERMWRAYYGNTAARGETDELAD